MTNTELFEKYYEEIVEVVDYCSMQYYLHNMSREDLKQDIYLFLLKTIHTYDSRKCDIIKPFLYMIVRYHIIVLLRRQGSKRNNFGVVPYSINEEFDDETNIYDVPVPEKRETDCINDYFDLSILAPLELEAFYLTINGEYSSKDKSMENAKHKMMLKFKKAAKYLKRYEFIPENKKLKKNTGKSKEAQKEIIKEDYHTYKEYFRAKRNQQSKEYYKRNKEKISKENRIKYRERKGK